MGEQYYYADGRKVPLTVSDRFVAVRTDVSAAAGAAARSVAARASTMTAPVNTQDIPEYGLTVFILPNGAAPADARTSARANLQSMLESTPELSSGPQVYQPAADTQATGLVPVGEIIVKFAPTTSEEARAALRAQYGLEVKKSDYPEPGADLLTTTGDAIAAANALQESDLVEFAQPNFVHLAPRLTYHPPSGTLEGVAAAAQPAVLADPGFASQWNLKKIMAPEAWAISQGSPNISVAIIDEGCDMTHEDLVYRAGYDAYSGDNDPQPSGNDAHGTACAGVAAMAKDNGRGGAGVAPGCKIVGVRIAKGIGGGYWDTTDAKVADGVRKAVDLGADVLSNSYGVGPSTAVTNAFKYAQTNGRGGKGCPIAAAAGNADAPPVIYPARLSPTIPGFLAVSATNEWDQRKSKTSLDGENWWGSSYGPEVDIAAPGVHIYATDIMGNVGYGSGNYIPNFNGTSSATPHVAGLMGLILSVDPGLRSWEVEDIVKLTADDLGAGGRDNEFGWGRINARRALEAASRIWYQIAVIPVFLGAGKECYMRLNARMYNPGINTVRLDALTITSHNPNWTAEVDRFEYRPNPGNVLAPRSGQDVRFNSVLLRANGNQSAWSYRWALNWSYTFWRPSAPGFPLSGAEPQVELAGGVSGENGHAEGVFDGSHAASLAPANTEADDTQSDDGGDSVIVNRRTRSITVVIR